MSSKAPLISIIMPAYNAEKFIQDSIKSVINQKYQNWELIIINDCSKDNTKSIIEKMKEHDLRITVINNDKNLGVADTRNRGIQASKGDWIAFLDSDDLWVKNKLVQQVDTLLQRGAEFIFSGCSFIDTENKNYNAEFNVPTKVDYKKLRKNNVITTSSVLIKKDYLLKFPMERDDIHEDFITWLRVLKTGVKAIGIDRPLTIYRVSRDSKSGNKVKSVMMTYKVHRYFKTNPLLSVYYTLNHAFNSYKKYSKLKHG